MKKEWIWFFPLVFSLVVFFRSFFLFGLLPIPSDTIVGLYHPYRDAWAQQYPNGIPFKNFLITDPVRQIIPWKELSIDVLSQFELPLWNPYEMTGKPLLGNFQSSPFYPLNIILFLKPFYLSWSLFVVSQILLSSIFMYLYLKNLKLHRTASYLGAMAFSFSGFSIAWLEWGTVVHTLLWLPMLLLSADMIMQKYAADKRHSLISFFKANLFWNCAFVASLVFSFFAGHLQVFIYEFLVTVMYIILKLYGRRHWLKIGMLFVSLFGFFVLITSIQWFPTIQFLFLSARNIDLSMNQEGWFIPVNQLIMFVAPDFFGNPATLNYWGVWNYGEFIGYVGIVPLLFACASLYRRDRKTYFFAGIMVVCLLFATKNPLSTFAYHFSVPFFSSAQPTRLIGIVSFSLSIMAALGVDYIYRFRLLSKKKLLLILPTLVLGMVLILMWCLVVLFPNLIPGLKENILVAKRNLILPTGLFLIGSLLYWAIIFARKNLIVVILSIVLLVTAFDLIRFGEKFTPFVSRDYFFPSTEIIRFLEGREDVFRVATLDNRILPPNFLTHYAVQSIEGYDPLYIQKYGEFVVSMERGSKDIEPPYGFNRIITPHNYNSQLFDLLNTKYVLSFDELKSPKMKFILQEGEVRLYENIHAINRVFFVTDVFAASDNNATIEILNSIDLAKQAVVHNISADKTKLSIGKAMIVSYQPNKVVIKTKNEGDGFLVFTDAYYPSWNVFVDGRQEIIYETDHAFRGVFVDGGEHVVEFRISLL